MSRRANQPPERVVDDDGERLWLNLRSRHRTISDPRAAVFKTVWGALLRRPGWVRFPSIPAKFGICDSRSSWPDSNSPLISLALFGSVGARHVKASPSSFPGFESTWRP